MSAVPEYRKCRSAPNAFAVVSSTTIGGPSATHHNGLVDTSSINTKNLGYI